MDQRLTEWTSYGLEDNLSIAEQLLHTCKDHRIFAFSGNLGAGKTTLIKSLCQFLGVEQDVVSPTFTLVHEYSSPAGDIYHFDFYRMKSEMEAYDIGVYEYLDSGSYCFLEWAEKIQSLLPEDTVWVDISVLSETSRLVKVNY
ncbi:MAG: tRNA (adenosine(37)-N6)-threonylcarbamoyltransferase complex ATPase subunit type 1 TsaE [Bacteroidota bacterium]